MYLHRGKGLVENAAIANYGLLDIKNPLINNYYHQHMTLLLLGGV